MRSTLSNVGSTATHSTEPVCPTYLLIASFVLLVVSTYVCQFRKVKIGLVQVHSSFAEVPSSGTERSLVKR